jgi:hypothetical protein
MRLIELMVALCVMAAAFPPLVSGLQPLTKLYRKTVALQRDLDANRFISSGFIALTETARSDTAEAVARWESLAETLTGAEDVEVQKVKTADDTEVYRAAWTCGGQSRFVDAIFKIF